MRALHLLSVLICLQAGTAVPYKAGSEDRLVNAVPNLTVHDLFW